MTRNGWLKHVQSEFTGDCAVTAGSHSGSRDRVRSTDDEQPNLHRAQRRSIRVRMEAWEPLPKSSRLRSLLTVHPRNDASRGEDDD